MVSGMPPLYFRDRSTAERGKITVFSLSFNVATGKKLGSGHPLKGGGPKNADAASVAHVADAASIGVSS
ncbi:MAG TPA: hypothetical protein VGM05_33415 [Planctomycetaceae bacterium]